MKNEPVHRWHGAHHYSDKVHLFLVAFLFFGIITLLWSYFSLSQLKIDKNTPPPNQITKPTTSANLSPTLTPAPTDTIYCTQEAKLCPDGKTYVGRTGPKCEFSLCPKN